VGLEKRGSNLESIVSQEGDVNTGHKDTPANNVGQYEMYLAAFQLAQANASQILFPIIKEMVSRSNSSLVYGAAWSLFADLTAAGPMVFSPFFRGMNCIQVSTHTRHDLREGSRMQP